MHTWKLDGHGFIASLVEQEQSFETLRNHFLVGTYLRLQEESRPVISARSIPVENRAADLFQKPWRLSIAH